MLSYFNLSFSKNSVDLFKFKCRVYFYKVYTLLLLTVHLIWKVCRQMILINPLYGLNFPVQRV